MGIYDYIKREEVAYTRRIKLADGWDWNMKEHLRLSYLYINGQFDQQNENRDLRPNKNIVLPIVNLQKRATDIDVKDIELFINSELYYKSFLLKKYHEGWVLENSIDTFIDDLIDSYVDYGGVLIRDTEDVKPEIIDLLTLDFCNQRNLIDNPFCINHEFSQSELREMTNWDKNAIERLIVLTKDEPSIIVKELIGVLPAEWLGKDKYGNNISDKKDELQIQVVAFYQDGNKQEQMVTLFSHKLPKLNFKFLKRDKIFGRALGRGGIEELFEPQIWTNFSEVKITEMLDSAAKTLHKTTDQTFKTRNNLRNADNNEVFVLQQGTDIGQMDTYPRNITAFENNVSRFMEHARLLGAANESIMGETAPSGTPFKLQQLLTTESHSLHEKRKGKISTFLVEIYKDSWISKLVKEITKGDEFLSTLSFDEMQEIGSQIAENQSNKQRDEQVLSGVLPADKELLKQKFFEEFMKGGNKKRIKILKNELKDVPVTVFVNIAGKQKNIVGMVDKLTNVFRQIFANPAILDDPRMARIFNQILEFSGLNPLEYSSYRQPQQAPMAQPLPLNQMQNA